MNKFGKRSREALNSSDPRWTEVMEIVLQHRDCSILEGHRDEAKQTEYFETGKSKIEWPDGEHNKKPSNAIDAVPYPIDWDDTERMRAFVFFVKGVATGLGYKVRLGADWDGDFTNKDQSFHDIPHMEFMD